MKARTWTLTAALGLLCLAGPAAAQLAPALQYVWGQNLEAFNKEDKAGVMATIDTRSPDFGPTSAALDALFKDRDQKAQLVDFVLMGHDDEFAVARVKTRTTGQPGSDFANNVTDAVVLFHQENGTWKLWSEKIIAVEIVP
jgi:hypothetical protein